MLRTRKEGMGPCLSGVSSAEASATGIAVCDPHRGVGLEQGWLHNLQDLEQNENV